MYKEMMAVYEGREGEKLVFQPRIKHWYDVNLSAGTLPERYRGMHLDEVYRDLNVAPREVWCPGAIGSEFKGYLSLNVVEGDDVEVWTKNTRDLPHNAESTDRIITEYRTPKGTIRQVQRWTEHGTTLMNEEYYLKDLSDIEVYKYILEERSYKWDKVRFEWGNNRFGKKIPVRANIQRVPIMWLIVGTMGFQRTVTMLWKHPQEMGELLQLLEKEHVKQIETYKGKPVVELNFVDNMHQDLCPPHYFKKYVTPFFERVMPKIQAQKMYTASHWDGYVKQLLPIVKETGLSGLECVTPKPQGDVTLQDMKEGMEEMFLRDGIPAVMLCPWVELDTLKECVKELIDTFYPRLILGFSDMLPANGEIERVRYVNEIVNEFNDSL